MSLVTDTKNLSLSEILHYSEVGLLDIEGADLIADAFREGYNDGQGEYSIAYDRGFEDGIIEAGRHEDE